MKPISASSESLVMIGEQIFLAILSGVPPTSGDLSGTQHMQWYSKGVLL
jgi:hypothetical protein